MKDKEYRENKKRVERYLDKWFKPLGLGWWDVDISFVREEKRHEPDMLAEVDTLWQYRKATIYFYLPVVKEVDDTKLEHNVVHELCHLLTAPTWSMIAKDASDEQQQINEYTTESVTNALLWIRGSK